MEHVKNVLEYNINQAIKALNKNGSGFGWQNHPNRNFTGKYIEGEPFDFCIITQNRTIVFDTKFIESKKWSIRSKDIKQAKNLNQCSQNKSTQALFVIYFKEAEKLVAIEATKVIEILKERRTISINDCVPLEYEELLT